MQATCRYDLGETHSLHFDFHQAGIQTDDCTSDARKGKCGHKDALKLVFVLSAQHPS